MAYSLLGETFGEYAVAMSFLLLRFYARVKVAGIRNLGLGDLFAGLAMIFYSLTTAGIYLLEKYGNNIGLNDQTAMEVPESKIPSLVLGSKLAFMNWIWYLCFIWCLKGVLLSLYAKMGSGVWQQERLVMGMSAFTVCTWLACVLTHVCICLPPSHSWQIKPYPGDNCTVRPPNYVVIATLNALTDFGVMLIPMPLLFKVKVPVRHKLILGAMFGSGIFVMIATILRAYYSLRSISDLPIALGWANREEFVATIVVCLPGIKPLFNNTTWFQSTRNGSRNRTPGGSQAYGKKFSGSGGESSTASNKDDSDKHFELGSVGWRRHPKGTQRLSSGASDEQIIIQHGHESKMSDDPRDIFVTQEYTVSSEDAHNRV
ncbi:hypothetical protein EV356DRAFT_524498 [Viridothelium virens]|uniref:Rhodopsin domain-containing protein n=1 Tax=Viridothelium virens TaxID=1048519 RepID=A0A6A6H744_VIRVR|nr:hypothetical protein EV356DRAFT_524498 [Viridothelium virens]